MKMEYEILRSRRKSIAIQITREGKIVVRAPLHTAKATIERFIEAQDAWIIKHMAIQNARIAKEQELLPEDILRMKNAAKQIIPARTMQFAQIMGLEPESIKITSAKTRFGSCSGKNGICFSWRLMQYDMRAVDYVIVHELAHIVHKNHGREFYALIEAYMPDYKERRKMLV